jgi:hypothetical protein
LGSKISLAHFVGSVYSVVLVAAAVGLLVVLFGSWVRMVAEHLAAVAVVNFERS